MKYLLPILCLLLTTNLYSQRKKKSNTQKLFKVQGGFFHDADPLKDFSGFNILSLGLAKVKEKKITGIDLDMILFRKKTDYNSGDYVYPNIPPLDYERRKESVDIGVYRTYALFGDINNGLYLGPLGTIGYAKNQLISNRSSNFPNTKAGLFVGAGFKGDYFLSLSKKAFLTISTKLVLFDVLVGNKRVENPILPISQQNTRLTEYRLIRPQFPLLLGFNFLIGR